jgi:hypothetical protein
VCVIFRAALGVEFGVDNDLRAAVTLYERGKYRTKLLMGDSRFLSGRSHSDRSGRISAQDAFIFLTKRYRDEKPKASVQDSPVYEQLWRPNSTIEAPVCPVETLHSSSL